MGESGYPGERRVECWYWRYRDASGDVRVTERALTADEAAVLEGAERIEGSLTFRGEEEDTAPDVFRTGQLPLDGDPGD
jgi:hypothetical protein